MKRIKTKRIAFGKEKAKEMLANPPHGKALTDKQKHLFQAVAHGWKPNAQLGGVPVSPFIHGTPVKFLNEEGQLKTFEYAARHFARVYQTGGQNLPIYTTNPKDQRLQAYKDSLWLSNNSPRAGEVAENFESREKPWNSSGVWDRLNRYTNNKLRPEGYTTLIDKSGIPSDYPTYTKPKQPVLYNVVDEADKDAKRDHVHMNGSGFALSEIRRDPITGISTPRQYLSGYDRDQVPPITAEKRTQTQLPTQEPQISLRTVPFQMGTYFSRPRQSQEAGQGQTDYFDKQTGRLIDTQQKGGIVDPLGQWAHPGEVTTIPSNRITMKGVNYPVLGVSDTGHRQMMQPGGEYKFDGNHVTEYPQAELGLSQTGGGGGLQMGGSVLTYQGTGDIQRSKPKFHPKDASTSRQLGGVVEWQIENELPQAQDGQVISNPAQDNRYVPSSSDSNGIQQLVEQNSMKSGSSGESYNPRQLPQVEISSRRTGPLGWTGQQIAAEKESHLTSGEIASALFLTPIQEAYSIPRHAVAKGIDAIRGQKGDNFFESEPAKSLGITGNVSSGIVNTLADPLTWLGAGEAKLSTAKNVGKDLVRYELDNPADWAKFEINHPDNIPTPGRYLDRSLFSEDSPEKAIARQKFMDRYPDFGRHIHPDDFKDMSIEEFNTWKHPSDINHPEIPRAGVDYDIDNQYRRGWQEPVNPRLVNREDRAISELTSKATYPNRPLLNETNFVGLRGNVSRQFINEPIFDVRQPSLVQDEKTTPYFPRFQDRTPLSKYTKISNKDVRNYFPSGIHHNQLGGKVTWEIE